MSTAHKTTNSRHFGIDLLRIVAMYMVCMIHVNLFCKAHGTLIPGKEFFYYFSNWTEAVGMIGVNLYALITGYVCLNSRWKLSRYIHLWLQVAYYTIGLLAVGVLLSMTGIFDWTYTIKSIVKQIIKLACGGPYWYFAAYTGLFFFIPFINSWLNQLDKRKHLILIIISCVLLPSISLQRSCIFSHGYNMIWLAVLYSAGAYVKRYQPNINKLLLIMIAGLCTTPIFILAKSSTLRGLYWDYTSPIMVIYSLAVFLFFCNIKIENKYITKAISWAAPLSFGVYLIHVHPWTWGFLNKYFASLVEQLNYPWWISIIGGLCIYVTCTIIEYTRASLFKIARAQVISKFLGNFITSRCRWVIDFILRKI